MWKKRLQKKPSQQRFFTPETRIPKKTPRKTHQFFPICFPIRPTTGARKAHFAASRRRNSMAKAPGKRNWKSCFWLFNRDPYHSFIIIPIRLGLVGGFNQPTLKKYKSNRKNLPSIPGVQRKKYLKPTTQFFSWTLLFDQLFLEVPKIL